MTPGKVITIRVSPQDCMAAVDIVRKLGGLPNGTSFSQVVSLALASTFQTLREHGVIPVRDGFEFADMLAPYPAQVTKQARKRSLEITGALKLTSSEQTVRPVPFKPAPVGMARYEELAFKLSNDSLNMTDAERDELSELTQKLFPEAP